jgi:hypothetical protein
MITLDDKITYPDLPMWEEFCNLTKNSSNEILPIAHTTVRTRLGFAKMHLTIQKQARNMELKRAMFEDVVINLVSSFEAIAQLLNEYYYLGIKSKIVTIDHIGGHTKQPEMCLRCKLGKANPHLADALDKVLKIRSPRKDWYAALIEFRHQALHRQHFIALSTVKGYFLPDYPNIMGPKGVYQDKRTKRFVVKNYTKVREIAKFTEALYERVIKTIELIYWVIVEYNKVKP